ncbi:vacuolar protein sorting-associated protein 33a [Anaeramoeba flamelloides]|uniref:Vacuolar protein sorting-associated protein 33a n=1 Tax=Anaeramoeba flamelloides TaxID=1746091 RepID=A0ABQ8XPM6_9EUKA|nr:vacuolar protein sorting-associated protein 33a [Anaeramoeba flamelloides]
MSYAVDLKNFKLIPNLGLYRTKIIKNYLEILDSVQGQKALILDNTLCYSLELILPFSVMKEHGISYTKFLRTHQGVIPFNKLIYIVRSDPSLMKILANHILNQETIKHNSDQLNSTHISEGSSTKEIKEENNENGIQKEKQIQDKEEKEFFVYFVPNITQTCEALLEKFGVSGSINYGNFNLGLIPYDQDVYSLSNELCFQQLISDDITPLTNITNSLIELQSFIGVIPNICYAGKYSKILTKMLLRKRKENELDDSIPPQIEHLFLIDRNLDLITPMATPLNYEGLIDHLYEINETMLQCDTKIFRKPITDKPTTRIQCNCNDKFFIKVRDLHITKIYNTIKNVVDELENAKNVKEHSKTLTQLSNHLLYLKQLKMQEKSIILHYDIVQNIRELTQNSRFFTRRLNAELSLLIVDENCINYIEELIFKNNDIVSTLKLLCLHSMITNGYKVKKYNFLINQIIQTYGYEHMHTILSLQKLGMFTKMDNKKNKKKFDTLRQSLNLINEKYENNLDITYIHSGVAPIIPRMAQMLFTKGWNALNEIINPLLTVDTGKEKQSISQSATRVNENKIEKPICLIFFVGGATFSEISALRFLNKHSKTRVHFVIGNSHITNGSKIIRDCFLKEDNF